MPQRGVYKWIEKFKNLAQALRMKEAAHAWLAAQSKTFFSEGIKKLLQRWKKCIEKQGDYVEKCFYYKFYIFIEIKFVSVVRIIIESRACVKRICKFVQRNLVQ